MHARLPCREALPRLEDRLDLRGDEQHAAFHHSQGPAAVGIHRHSQGAHRAREAHGRRAEERRPLLLATLVTAVVLVAEAAGGILTGSLALLSDAGHMLTDLASLVLALVALGMAGRPATLRKTFGYHRLEVLAALLNGLTLWAVVAFLAWEAVQRLHAPSAVAVEGMLMIAGVGLAANLVTAFLLGRVEGGGLNLRGAFLHVIADLLGSVGTIAAGGVILFTGWLAADPLASLLICALILFSSWTLIRDAVNVLMEGTPRGMEVEAVQGALLEEAGVKGVHDLHLWTVTSGFHALSAHVEVDPELDRERVLRRLNFTLRERFGLTHTTLQLEEPRRPHAGALQIEPRQARPDSDPSPGRPAWPGRS
ncbi:MAG: cation diffusion facilitator family transporter [Gemmatimonadota bacterium]